MSDDKPRPDSEEETAADKFAEILRKNAENDERVRQERIKNNNNVKRSHRLNKEKT